MSVGCSGNSVSFGAVQGSHIINVGGHPWVTLPLSDSEDSSYRQGAALGVPGPGFPWLSPQAVPAQGEQVSLVNRSGPYEDRESALLEQSSLISQAQERSREYSHHSYRLPAMEDVIINHSGQVPEGSSSAGGSGASSQWGSFRQPVRPPPGFHPGGQCGGQLPPGAHPGAQWGSQNSVCSLPGHHGGAQAGGQRPNGNSVLFQGNLLNN